MSLDPVARLGDKISHSNAAIGQLIGAGVGLVVGAAVVVGIAVATGGVGAAVAVPILVGCTVTGASFGKWIGGGSQSETGEVKEGASRSFVGPNIRPIVRFKDGIECQDSLGANVPWSLAIALITVAPIVLAAKAFSVHSGAFVNDGRWHVEVERKLISFIGSKTSCDGDVSKPIDGDREAGRTLVGGPVVQIIPSKQLKGDNPVMEWSLFLADWGSTIFGLTAAEKIALPVTAAGLKLANQLCEKQLGATHPATIITGLLGATVGLADAIIGAHTSTPDEAVQQGANVLVNAGLLGPDQVPKIKDAANGPPQELPRVKESEAMVDAMREDLRTDYGPLGTAPGTPNWVSWSGRTAK